jgi:hypothetical protein
MTMTSRRIEVLFYGLFMDPEVLRAQGANPENPRHASAPGFALRIGQRATLQRDPSGVAHGIVMELTHAEIDHLYADPSVRAYRPEAVLCMVADGSSVPALCFNLIEPPSPDEANADYAVKLRDLAARLGLPQEYVSSIH